MNDHVHPLFTKLMESMYGEHKFDIDDDALMHDICGKKLAPPIQSLLDALRQFEMTEQSFGADGNRTKEFIVPLLKDLRKACLEAFNEL